MSEERLNAIKERFTRSVEAGLDIDTALDIAKCEVYEFKREVSRLKHDLTIEECVNKALKELGITVS